MKPVFLAVRLAPAVCISIYFILFPACSCDRGGRGPGDAAYMQGVERWHRDRIERLTSPTGWLSVAGLYWLEDGKHSMGSDPSNDIVLPQGKAPALVGTITVKDGTVRFDGHRGVEVIHDGRPVTSLMLEHDGDGGQDPTRLELGTLTWYVIERGDRLGIRLKDSRNPLIAVFRGIDRYSVRVSWKIEATFEPFTRPRTLPIENIVGIKTNEPCPGSLSFELEGKAFRLDPIAEPGADRLFIVFADETTGEETYGGGRFLYVDAPDADGKAIIDFNRAYNPPCAFNQFTTCPLPPPQNVLPVSVTAGEKSYTPPSNLYGSSDDR
jgi:uncharacterized protein (DUF1684 family)